jgi:hypothetical protein
VEPVAKVLPQVPRNDPAAGREQALPEQPRATREVTRESVSKPESQDGDAAAAKLATGGEQLVALATKLKDGPAPGAVETWLGNVDGFLQDHRSWLGDLSSLARTNPRSLRPLRDRLTDLAWDLERQKKPFELDRDWDAKPRRKRAKEAARQDQVIADREREVAAYKPTLGQYLEPPNTKIEGPLDTTEWRNHADRLPTLFLEWLLTAAFKQAMDRPGKWTAKLLDFLKELKRNQESGPFIDVIGNTKTGDREAGLSVKNWIILKIDLPSRGLLKVLSGEDAENTEIRHDLVTETASTFLHEAAHVRQIRVYGNASFPWKPHPDYGGYSAGEGDSKGIPYAKWTPDVQKAFEEFKRGPGTAQVNGDTKWKGLFDALHATEYYHAGNELKPGTGLDDRASELVSHLVELAYAWGEERFRTAFPLCTALLDRTILWGT